MLSLLFLRSLLRGLLSRKSPLFHLGPLPVDDGFPIRIGKEFRTVRTHVHWCGRRLHGCTVLSGGLFGLRLWCRLSGGSCRAALQRDIFDRGQFQHTLYLERTALIGGEVAVLADLTGIMYVACRGRHGALREVFRAHGTGAETVNR